MVIKVPGNFNAAESLTFLNRSKNECLHFVEGNQVYKLLQIEGKKVLVLLELSDNEISIKALNCEMSILGQKKVSDFVHDWFDLGQDLSSFYKLAVGDKVLDPLVKKFSGLRMITIPDLFEVLSWSVTGQQINLTFAYTLRRRFVETFGEKLEHEGRIFHLHPKPEVISELDPEELKKLQFTSRKAEYLIGIAKEIKEGRINKEGLLKLSKEQAVAELVKVRGIGNWTANYTLMKCIKHPDAFPIEDVGIHQALKNILQLDSKPAIPEILELSKNWTGWKSYATFYLWRSLIQN